MPKYIKNDHVIYASSFAYSTIYKGLGYLPLEEENEPTMEEAPQVQDVTIEMQHTQHTQERQAVEEEEKYSMEEEDDYGDDVEINNDMPVRAQVALLSYAELKAKAKELGIEKYANIKKETLVELVSDALEAQLFG